MRKLILLAALIASFFSFANAQQLQWLDVFTADSSCHLLLYASCIVNDKFGYVFCQRDYRRAGGDRQGVGEAVKYETAMGMLQLIYGTNKQ